MDGGSYEHCDSNKEDDTCRCSENSTCTSCSSAATLPSRCGRQGKHRRKASAPPGTRHPADFALGSRVGNTDLKALILPDDGDA